MAPGPARPRSTAQRDGAWAEQRVLRLLRRRGWELLERNWRCRWGELDLIVRKPGRLLLVEVKGRRAGSLDGRGTAALRWQKRRRLARAWDCWLAAHPRWEKTPVEQVAALVPLPPARAPVRWLRLGD
ncbi:YraN family protein [Cyanobium sp. Copco_Reservoir_LC18]|jgi:putative endonuclease|uniref:YraN family protein n=1 Tax=Cyanobium sp. Copco_Reservoir_LC18 TaxID=1328305 RepID=UPI0013593930|nr:YraN family protein [Cyanobium sp. Copco_Reservoir_LC18]